MLGNQPDWRNRGRFLLCHHEVVVVWPCPRALPSPALVAACGAFGDEPHPRNAPNCHTLPAPRGAWVLTVGASVPTRAPPLGGGGHARPLLEEKGGRGTYTPPKEALGGGGGGGGGAESTILPYVYYMFRIGASVHRPMLLTAANFAGYQ